MLLNMDWDLQFGELTKDLDFVQKCENLKENMEGVQRVMEQLMPLKQQYDTLPVQVKIELDLLSAFLLTSYQWVNIRLQGQDPADHPVKHELQRIKAMMTKYQQIKDRDKRPKVNVEAAKRFVRNGLYDPQQSGEPPNKKIRFTDD